MNFIDPTREQFKAIYGLSSDQPVSMLNLLKFREQANYGPGVIEHSVQPISGRDAYERYSAEAESVFRYVGGRQLWLGQPLVTIIGPSDEHWSLAFIAFYPTVQAFLDMVKSAEYQRATRHRSAALLDGRLICCSQLQAGKSFSPSSYLLPK